MSNNTQVQSSASATWLFAVIPLLFFPARAAADGGPRAFLDVYKVLLSPRCVNCHPAGDAPLQGDDSHTHAFRVRRGEDGKGVTSMRCTNCHQAANQSGEHTPPGSPDPKVDDSPRWRLPSAKMPMVFERRTSQQLCRQLLNKSKNGGLTTEDLVHHVEADPFVLWAWRPGEGRSTPPLTHAEFVSRFRAWLGAGAGCPN